MKENRMAEKAEKVNVSLMSQEPAKEPYVPFDPDDMTEVDCCRAQINKTLAGINYELTHFSKAVQKLDMRDARLLNVPIELRDCKNIATEVTQYFGIIKMIMQNFDSNFRRIYLERLAYQREVAQRIARNEALPRLIEKNKRDVERRREKRKAERAADQNNY